jgi:hypothetical protein
MTELTSRFVMLIGASLVCATELAGCSSPTPVTRTVTTEQTSTSVPPPPVTTTTTTEETRDPVVRRYHAGRANRQPVGREDDVTEETTTTYPPAPVTATRRTTTQSTYPQ